MISNPFADEVVLGRPTSLDIETIKASLDCRYLAEFMGLDISAQDKVPHWTHPERTPSVQLYDDHVYAYCCGEAGDVIDFYQGYTGCSIGKAIDDLSRLIAIGDLEVGAVKKRERPPLLDFTLEVGQSVCAWTSAHVQFRRERWAGVDPATDLSGWMLPFAGGFLVPHWYGLGVVGVKVRSFDGRKSAWPGSVFTSQLYVAKHFANTAAVICEGESDAWAMASHTGGVDVYALPCGAGVWRESWLGQLDQYTWVYVCLDNDEAGRKAAAKVSAAVGHDRALPLAVPQLVNDVNEAWARFPGWKPEFR
jgi:hypothetical protein